MSFGGYDDQGQWVWNCSCDPGPEGQHQWYCAKGGISDGGGCCAYCGLNGNLGAELEPDGAGFRCANRRRCQARQDAAAGAADMAPGHGGW